MAGLLVLAVLNLLVLLPQFFFVGVDRLCGLVV
jgi:hypothetical protein